MDQADYYRVENPDQDRSPFTGMTRKHYIECAKYVLNRAFVHVDSFDDYIIFPEVPGKTYPQPGSPDWRYRSLEFEGLRRTFALAGPLLHVEPEVEIRGIKLADYYAHHLRRALTPGHPNSIPMPEDLPDATYQFTCELGGLCMFLLLMPDLVWPSYDQGQKDAIAQTLSKWAHHRTTQNNWRFFNIEMMSFLKRNGYEIDEDLLKDHLRWINSYHAGDGWYLEQNYNYYTISMYSIYQTVWCRTFGDDYYPEIAETYEQSARQLMASFPYLFSRRGHINMWARSICYRLWVAGGFPMAFMLKGDAPFDPGWARRLCSGAVLQFTGREDFYDNEVPSLGFYGHREFLLQGYSCAASPFTMFMPFLALTLPESSPFWTAIENDGPWDSFGKQPHQYVLAKPGMALVNYSETGASEIKPAKVNEEDHNYNRLCYNTDFPWEDHDPAGGTAMEYCYRSKDPRDLDSRDSTFYLGLASREETEKDPNIYSTPVSVLYNGYREEVLYRQLVFRKPPNNGSGYIIDLAEIAVPLGVIRIDRSRLAFEYDLTLAHFGLPHLDDQPAVVEQQRLGDRLIATARIQGRQLALVCYGGFDQLRCKVHGGRNAEAEESTVLYLEKTRLQKNPPMELMITAMLHKTDDSPWTAEELNPIKSLALHDTLPSGSTLGATIETQDQARYTIDFNHIDGLREC